MTDAESPAVAEDEPASHKDEVSLAPEADMRSDDEPMNFDDLFEEPSRPEPIATPRPPMPVPMPVRPAQDFWF
ncbi:hypothetical protein [Thiorhodovibrio winogradskyi]|uniref:hypothetical protein n=1 Tax=Thiorhodovibrio winogradskyi TaxID=77007 RepID=UPI002E29462F|nr:hypothetical protein [Thiorhodovibrio winogradskyi]